MNVPRRHLRDGWQRRIRLIQTHRRHGGGRWRAATVTARIVVGRAVARTVVVVIYGVLSSCSILRRSHDIIGLREMLSRARLRRVGKSQPR